MGSTIGSSLFNPLPNLPNPLVEVGGAAAPKEAGVPSPKIGRGSPGFLSSEEGVPNENEGRVGFSVVPLG